MRVCGGIIIITSEKHLATGRKKRVCLLEKCSVVKYEDLAHGHGQGQRRSTVEEKCLHSDFKSQVVCTLLSRLIRFRIQSVTLDLSDVLG